MLLDAGEGCQLRLSRHGYSPTNIDIIVITHGHGDHVNGVPGLLQSMAVNKRRRPLRIYAPPSVARFIIETLEATATGERLGFPVETIEIRGSDGQPLWEKGGDKLVLEWFPTCHTRESHGYRLRWLLRPRIRVDTEPPDPDSWRSLSNKLKPEQSLLLVYTGDTAPCRAVLENSRGADLLIHEATFAANMEKEALERLHSSSIHAAIIAKNAGVGLLVLTHISARYSGFEARRLLLEARYIHSKAVLAYDGMKIRLLAPTREVLLSQILASP